MSRASDGLRVNLWSGPRNVSTALMYAFAQRADTRVIDEPLYAHYLRESGADHPGREDVLSAMDSDGARVIRRTVLGPSDRPVLFLKQMAHHLDGIEDPERTRLWAESAHVLLVRDPREMLPSLVRQIPHPTLRDTALATQTELLDELARHGRTPPVVDARRLLLDPPRVLAAVCDRLDIPWDPAMLSWPAGARPEDGVWAPHWYEAVHRSTGFRPYRPKDDPVPDSLLPLLDACRPHYDRLASLAIEP